MMPEMTGEPAEFTPVGDAALMVSTPLARELLLSCQDAPLPGVTEVVPALNLVTMLFDPLVTTAGELGQVIRTRLPGLSALPAGEGEGRSLLLPVQFGGPDLEWCAGFTSQTVTAFIDEVCALPFTVAFLGYTPGFAFLTGLPAHLQMPRLSAPRERVPAGSVFLSASASCRARTGDTPSRRRMGRVRARRLMNRAVATRSNFFKGMAQAPPRRTRGRPFNSVRTTRLGRSAARYGRAMSSWERIQALNAAALMKSCGCHLGCTAMARKWRGIPPV